MAVCAVQDRVVIPLSTGETMVGGWHQSMMDNPKCLGRCLDLIKPTSRFLYTANLCGMETWGTKPAKTWMEDVHHLLAALRGLGFSLCFQQDKPEPVVQNGA